MYEYTIDYTLYTIYYILHTICCNFEPCMQRADFKTSLQFGKPADTKPDTKCFTQNLFATLRLKDPLPRHP